MYCAASVPITRCNVEWTRRNSAHDSYNYGSRNRNGPYLCASCLWHSDFLLVWLCLWSTTNFQTNYMAAGVPITCWKLPLRTSSWWTVSSWDIVQCSVRQFTWEILVASLRFTKDVFIFRERSAVLKLENSNSSASEFMSLTLSHYSLVLSIICIDIHHSSMVYCRNIESNSVLETLSSVTIHSMLRPEYRSDLHFQSANIYLRNIYLFWWSWWRP